MTQWMRPPEAANYLGVSKSWLAKLRVIRGGPEYSKVGRIVTYRREDLDRWLTDGRVASTTMYLSAARSAA